MAVPVKVKTSVWDYAEDPLFKRVVANALFSVGLNPSEVLDFVTEVLITMREREIKGEVFENHYKVAYATAKNLARTEFRKRKPPEKLARHLRAFALSPQGTLANTEELAHAYTAIATLSREELQIAANDYFGFTLEQIADDTGSSLASISRRRVEYRNLVRARAEKSSRLAAELLEQHVPKTTVSNLIRDFCKQQQLPMTSVWVVVPDNAERVFISGRSMSQQDLRQVFVLRHKLRPYFWEHSLANWSISLAKQHESPNEMDEKVGWFGGMLVTYFDDLEWYWGVMERKGKRFHDFFTRVLADHEMAIESRK